MRRAVLAAVVLCGSLPAFADPPGMTVPVGSAPPPVVVAPDAPWMTPPGMTPLQEPGQPAISAQPGVESYRLQTLAADGAALLFVFAAAGSHGQDADHFGQLALGTYLLGAPLVHAVHGRPGRAVGSLAMRVGIPFVAAFIGGSLAKSGDHCTDYCDSNGEIAGIVLGAMAGMVTAVTIDSAVLAKGDERPRSIGPTITPMQGGMSVGVAGAW